VTNELVVSLMLPQYLLIHRRRITVLAINYYRSIALYEVLVLDEEYVRGLW
jgi:hypothetical protein